MIGQNIRRLRLAREMTQRDLAREVDTTEAQVSQWERGVIVPSWKTAGALAAAFGVTLDELNAPAEPAGAR